MNDPTFGLGERLNRLARTMVPGALGGRTNLASPRIAVPGMVPPVTPGPEPSGAGVVAGIVYLNNSTGDRDGSGNLIWDSAYAVGDRTWFDFPFGGDEALLKITRVGMAVATFTFQNPGTPTDARLIDNKTGILAIATGEEDDTLGIAVAYYTNFGEFDPFDEATITADTSADTEVGAMSVVFYDGFPFTAVPPDWDFITTEGD